MVWTSWTGDTSSTTDGYVWRMWSDSGCKVVSGNMSNCTITTTADEAWGNWIIISGDATSSADATFVYGDTWTHWVTVTTRQVSPEEIQESRRATQAAMEARVEAERKKQEAEVTAQELLEQLLTPEEFELYQKIWQGFGKGKSI